jgi:hypothetical protein
MRVYGIGMRYYEVAAFRLCVSRAMLQYSIMEWRYCSNRAKRLGGAPAP